MAPINEFEEYFGENCENCKHYGVWNNGVLEIPCMNCAMDGIPGGSRDHCHHNWNWRWNGVTCYGSSGNRRERTLEEVFEHALMFINERQIDVNQVVQQFIPKQHVNQFTHWISTDE